jgi:flavin reductase (DIM6/NTAB) family NADH-FMN oxidoreductase RutF
MTSENSSPVQAVPIDPAVFRAALGGHPAGVVIVTAQDETGPVGLTATSFVSISLDPPLVAFAVDSGSSTWQRLSGADALVIHLLSEEQHELASTFARRGVDRFAPPTAWTTLETGEPLLVDAPAWLRCSVDRVLELGDHHFVVARVCEAFVTEHDRPLLYHRRGFHGLGALETASARR